MTVHWRGQSAEYTPEERLIMRDLPVKEQAFVHTLKHFTSGEIQNPLEIQGIKPPAPAGSLASSDQQSDRVPRPGTSDVTPVYTDPEDIEFGGDKPKRKRPVYAVT